jgi:GNAT superfamily N-acetyltransferase
MSKDAASFRAEARLNGGKTVVMRPLRASDEQALGDYFVNLSANTRSLFAPHSFDRDTAHSICCGAEERATVRFVAEDERGNIIAYFILHLEITDEAAERYDNLDPDSVCSVAPSVADEWQGQGLGRQMMRYVMEIAAAFGNEQMILSGGVQAENEQAMHFYRRMGFRKVRDFQDDVPRYDMMTRL